MSYENQEPLTPAEQAELQRRFPRIAYWVGAASHHPDIHREDAEQNEPDNRPRVHNITVSVPLNTGIVGGVISREELIVATDISFEDIFDRLCAKMDLNPRDALLGYKFNRDLRRTAYAKLSNEDDLQAAMARGVGLIERARKRRVVLEIQNMQSAREAAMALMSQKQEDEVDQHVNAENMQPIHQAAIASIGRKRPADEIALRSDDVQKKMKTTTFSGASASSSSTININVANYIPLGDRGGQRRINMSPADSDRPLSITLPSSPVTKSSSNPQTPPADYPAISVALDELHESFPIYDLPQYASALSNHGVVTVDNIRNADDEALVQSGLPPVVVGMVRQRAMILAMSAEGQAVSAPRY